MIIPEQIARQHQMLAVNIEADTVVVAATNPHDARVKSWLDSNLGRPYKLVLTGTQNLLASIDAVYAPKPRKRMMLGELLLQAGVITAEQLATALERQHHNGRPLGEVLEELGYISSAVVQEHLQQQVRSHEAQVQAGKQQSAD